MVSRWSVYLAFALERGLLKGYLLGLPLPAFPLLFGIFLHLHLLPGDRFLCCLIELSTGKEISCLFANEMNLPVVSIIAI